MSEEVGEGVAAGEDGAGEQATSEAMPAGGRPKSYVLDASALLCLVNGEPGADRVIVALPQAAVSAVNLAEAGTKLSELGADADEARALLAPST